ncbi:MAG: hypothetical protein KatS3mg062_1471 [Tepidiforma sp.]|nr:MAG: hypothetical protein KatS3mg062_1471 [Tepidiforma sp.]
MDATTERLLAAAREIFEEEGFRGATTRKIAARAGVNEVTLFRHFANKEELIGAAIERGHREAVERLAAHPLPAAPRDLEAELRPYLRLVLRAFSASGRGVRTALAEWEHLPAFHAWLMGPSEAVLAEIERYLRAAAGSGLLRPGADPAAVTHLLVAALFSHGLLPAMMPERFEGGAEASFERCVDVVLDAIRPDRDRRSDQ